MSHVPTPPPGAAKPATRRGAARRAALIEAAREAFFAQGFEAANVNDIVASAGGSLATLYAHFGSKEGLFLAVIDDVIARGLDPMAGANVSGLPLEAGLQQLGERYLEALAQPIGQATFRLLVSESARRPHLLARFLEAGLGRTQRAVAAFLEERAAAGELPSGEIAFLATAFVDMLRGQRRIRAVAGLETPLGPEARRAHAQRVARLFCLGALAYEAPE